MNKIKKHFFYYLLIIISLIYGQFTQAVEKFVVEIDIPRISYFAIERYLHPISKGSNTLGRISFKNNTKDGFRVSIKSTNGGALVSEETLDGEYNIPYDITFKPLNQVLDTNIVANLNPELYQEIKIPFLYLTGEASMMSFGDYELIVYIEDTHNALEMAGTYKDKLMIEYADL